MDANGSRHARFRGSSFNPRARDGRELQNLLTIQVINKFQSTRP